MKNAEPGPVPTEPTTPYKEDADSAKSRAFVAAMVPKPKPPIHLRISQLDLCDYRAFPGPDVTSIQLLHEGRGKGLSLLLYGENGSGKSSLGRALRDLLESSSSKAKDFDNSVHVFSEPPSPNRGVTIHFDHPEAAAPIEWRPESKAHRSHPLFAAMAKSRGWMDYRTLWSALQFQTYHDYADVFGALAETLLMDCVIPASNNRTFGVLWQAITTMAAKRPTRTPGGRSDLAWIEGNLEDFNASLAGFLPDLTERTNSILAKFAPWTEIEMTFKQKPSYNSRIRSKFTTGQIALRVTFRGRKLAQLDGFLNEARITAIALSLFLAALTLSTPPRIASPEGDIYFPRILVLDDILISMDMAHRRPLLQVIVEHFSDWQVFLLTHDRSWYEVAKQILDGKPWRPVEMFSVPFGDYEQPLVKGDVDHLAKAKAFLAVGEIKAAAVHLRTKFELVLKEACREIPLTVAYVDDPKKWEVSQFWDSVKAYWREKNRTDLTPLANDLSHSLSWVLNPHSHSRAVDYMRQEIANAVSALERLEIEVKTAIRDRKQTALDKAKKALDKATGAIPQPAAPAAPALTPATAPTVA